MAVFFEGRQTHNSEYNIELGDGGDITSMVFYFMGWLFFLKNPVCTYMYVYVRISMYVYICTFVYIKMHIYIGTVYK